MPKTIEVLDGEFILNDKFGLSFGKFKSENLSQYSTRFLKHLANKTGLFFSNIYLDRNLKEEPVFKIDVIGQAQLKLGENESYKLEILNNKILLNAETEVGAYRGLETLLQLLTVNDGNYIFPNLKIVDEPRFPWRGLMIDVSRHFMPIDVIKRNIDGMAAVKLNVLHLHLSDDQGFRVESKVLPKLHQLASDGLYFTQSEIKEIESLSYDLSKVAEIGLKSLQAINDGETILADWKRKSTEILKNCKAPRGESEIMIINSVQELVNMTK
jgi:hexosaminidase